MIAQEKLAKIVGPRNTSSKPMALEVYSSDMSFVNPVRPTCIVKPKSAVEIGKIVKLANRTGTPLVPVSSGEPRFRGDTVPCTGGAVIVDMKRMNRIIRVDRYHRVAMVETGVTFGELIPAVEKEGIRLNMPLMPKKNKSVVGSMLEREPVIMPKYQWDISDPLACVEVYFGTGDDFRTGQAAGPGTIEEQWAAGAVQKAPYGPGPIALHRIIQGAQGTMGIVTWASLRCELLPQVEEPFVIGSSRLDRLFEVTHMLVKRRLANECFIMNRANLASIMAGRWPDDFQEMFYSLPPWILFYNLAGYEYLPEERVKYQIRDIRDITREWGLNPGKSTGSISANEILKTVQKPSDEPYWKLRKKGACQDIFFLTIYDKLEDLIATMNKVADRAGYPASEMGVYIQPLVQGTSIHCEFNLFYDPHNKKEAERIRSLSDEATKRLMSAGAFFSRPYGKNARMIVNRDAGHVAGLNKLKGILDPNNIMNPGKLCF